MSMKLFKYCFLITLFFLLTASCIRRKWSPVYCSINTFDTSQTYVIFVSQNNDTLYRSSWIKNRLIINNEFNGEMFFIEKNHFCSANAQVKNGKLYGKVESYYEDGSLKSISIFNNKAKQEKRIDYWRNGNIYRILDFTNKERFFVKYYGESGLLTNAEFGCVFNNIYHSFEEIWEHNRIVKILFYEDSKLVYKIDLINECEVWYK